jgi:hypothetical protein
MNRNGLVTASAHDTISFKAVPSTVALVESLRNPELPRGLQSIRDEIFIQG